MEIRSGSGRTSSRLANEKRSRVTGREGKGLLLKQGGLREPSGRASLASKRRDAQGGRARQHASVRARASKSNRKRRASADAGYGRRPARSRVCRRCRRARRAARPPGRRRYLTSTLAPAASSWALAFSASSLETFSRTALGAPSTRSLASFRPRLVRDRTSLMTWIFLSPAPVRMTSNSSFSSSAGAASAPPPAAGRGGGHRRGRGHPELVLELLEELGQLEDGHAGDGVEDLFFGCHGGAP